MTMMNRKKFFLIPMMVLTLILGLAPAVTYADEADEENICVSVQYNDENIPEEEQINLGVSDVCPDDEGAQVQSVSRPTKVWNIKTKGKYNFSGDPGSQTLYTNYKFKGKTSYTFYVKNTGKYAMTVKAKRLTKTYASTKISSGKSASVTFSNIKSDTEFYLTFSGSSFSGYIK